MSIPAHINRQCEDLSSLLGDTCLPCAIDERNEALSLKMASIYRGAFQDDADPCIELMRRVADKGRQLAAQLAGNDRIVFAVPLQHHGTQRWFAIGRTWQKNIDQFQRMLDIGTEASKRQYILDVQQGSIDQAELAVRQSLQERNWIRELASYTHDRKRTSSSALTNRVLAQLQTMVGADAIALLPATLNDQTDQIMRPAMQTAGVWKLDDFRQLLKFVGLPHTGDYIVQNDRNFQLQNGICKELIVVQVGTSVALGYLLAINRRIDSKVPLRRISDRKFTGTEAAMLIEAAAFFESEVAQQHMMDESEKLIIGTLRSMSSAIEARDPYTRGHSERVARLSYKLAKKLSIPIEKCREIYITGVLHDIGKIGIPDHVLLKPGALEPEELAIIQRHPSIGHHILSDLKRLDFVLPGVLYHHERWDGRGYPHQLKGEEIPLMARILAVADSFDAMTSSRPYRSAMLVERAKSIMFDGAGAQWDHDICHTFLKWLDDRTADDNCEDPLGVMQEELDFNANNVSTQPTVTASENVRVL